MYDGLADAQDPGPEGHRQRLRRRFLAAGADALADYELIELLLFLAKPRGDVKPLAKRLIARFGSFAETISAEPAELAKLDGMGEASVAALKTAKAAADRLLGEPLLKRPVLSGWKQLLDYCHAAMAHEPVEVVRVLYLDKKNRLIQDELQGRGTIDHTPLYPREVVKRALDLGASALIVVHNHPTGDPTPSQADISTTAQLKEAAATLGIVLHDHLIVARHGHVSFRSKGLL
ncbi:DNA repair protein RadC [Thalassobaculum sp. OXR-137]|uniref:RadC family protein n=1 Tax=Thalassobaculum sp. OXR-137 TaxID=3100173 RepID=UPI002AC8A937|nr:DNA repair protein RadC [Thalassobaculum sp. OXR-137]WPZ36789.1 DNA repair protein RadC [Thalassobaculum sp. OXR-137]